MATQEIIDRLQAVRREKGISYQAIVDGTAALGMPVSMSTVKRVFGSDAGLYDFRYDSTIRPIAAVVLGEDAQPEQAPAVYAELAAATKMLELKTDTIDTLTAQVEEQRREIAKAHAAIQHKTRVEILLAVADAGLAVVLLVFYVAHAIMGW